MGERPRRRLTAAQRRTARWREFTHSRRVLVGHRRGEQHPNARLTDHEIEVMREMHTVHGFGYRRLAKIFEVSRGYARKVCKFERRP